MYVLFIFRHVPSDIQFLYIVYIIDVYGRHSQYRYLYSSLHKYLHYLSLEGYGQYHDVVWALTA